MQLHELFKRVAAKVPEIRGVFNYNLPKNRKIVKGLHYSTTAVEWNLRVFDEIPAWITPISDEHAEALIIAACVKWLLKSRFAFKVYPMDRDGVTGISMTRADHLHPFIAEGSTEVEALLLAVEAVADQEKGT